MTKLEVLSIAVLAGAIAAALPASAAQTSSVDGWYAPDQATRGKGSYNANCVVCNSTSLQGGDGTAERRTPSSHAPHATATGHELAKTP